MGKCHDCGGKGADEETCNAADACAADDDMERGGIAARLPLAAWLYKSLLPLKLLFDWLDFSRGLVVFGS